MSEIKVRSVAALNARLASVSQYLDLLKLIKQHGGATNVPSEEILKVIKRRSSEARGNLNSK
jgi:hypothetical protein